MRTIKQNFKKNLSFLVLFYHPTTALRNCRVIALDCSLTVPTCVVLQPSAITISVAEVINDVEYFGFSTFHILKYIPD